MNTLFRPFLLDGITMLGLAGETELANQFSHIQKIFLNALRQESGTTIVLGEYLPIADLESAVDEYTVLIIITTLIISKKPGNTGISRDIRTEFTTDLLLSD